MTDIIIKPGTYKGGRIVAPHEAHTPIDPYGPPEPSPEVIQEQIRMVLPDADLMQMGPRVDQFFRRMDVKIKVLAEEAGLRAYYLYRGDPAEEVKACGFVFVVVMEVEKPKSQFSLVRDPFSIMRSFAFGLKMMLKHEGIMFHEQKKIFIPGDVENFARFEWR